MITSTNLVPGLTWIRVERCDLTVLGAQRFLDLLLDLARANATIGFTFDGWDRDPRAIYAIPEIADFMRATLPVNEDGEPDEFTLQAFVHRLYDDSALFRGGADGAPFGCYRFLLMAVGAISATPVRSGEVRLVMDRAAVTWAADLVRGACERAQT